MRAVTLALVLFALFALPVFASNITFTIVGSQGTWLAGTKVELLQDSVVIASGKADTVGNVSFLVPSGDYVVHLTRGYYPDFVTLLQLQNDTSMPLFMMMGRSYGVLYGTVKGVGNYDGLQIRAVRGGIVKASAKVGQGGAYVLPYLDAQDYDISLSDQSYAIAPSKVSIANTDAVLLDFKTAKIAQGGSAVGEKGAPSVTILQQPQGIGSIIKVRVVDGSVAASGATVQVLTPDGAASIVADNEGVAMINAPRYGKYAFTYGSGKAEFEIKKPQAQSTGAEGGNVAPATYVPKSGAAAADVNALIIVLVGGLGIIALVAVVAVYFAFKKGVHKGKGHEHAHHKAAMHEKHPHRAKHEAAKHESAEQ